jgi:uncharacterized protein
MAVMNICSIYFIPLHRNQSKKKMSRPQQNRKIETPPLMLGYKPFGIPRSQLESISLKFDEYEAIRLLDYKGCTQEQAA